MKFVSQRLFLVPLLLFSVMTIGGGGRIKFVRAAAEDSANKKGNFASSTSRYPSASIPAASQETTIMPSLNDEIRIIKGLFSGHNQHGSIALRLGLHEEHEKHESNDPSSFGLPQMGISEDAIFKDPFDTFDFEQPSRKLTEEDDLFVQNALHGDTADYGLYLNSLDTLLQSESFSLINGMNVVLMPQDTELSDGCTLIKMTLECSRNSPIYVSQYDGACEFELSDNSATLVITFPRSILEKKDSGDTMAYRGLSDEAAYSGNSHAALTLEGSFTVQDLAAYLMQKQDIPFKLSTSDRAAMLNMPRNVLYSLKAPTHTIYLKVHPVTERLSVLLVKRAVRRDASEVEAAVPESDNFIMRFVYFALGATTVASSAYILYVIYREWLIAYQELFSPKVQNALPNLSSLLNFRITKNIVNTLSPFYQQEKEYLENPTEVAMPTDGIKADSDLEDVDEDDSIEDGTTILKRMDASRASSISISALVLLALSCLSASI
jgi:hypothetical protein